VVLGILEFGQDFCRTCGGQPLSRMVTTNLKCIPTPCKRRETNTAALHSCTNGVQYSRISKKIGDESGVVKVGEEYDGRRGK
jgi:hypothetical protein